MVFQSPKVTLDFDWESLRQPSRIATGGYEFRPTAWLTFSPMPVHVCLRFDTRQWDAYALETDCETRAWAERANREDCWRDWWKTGREWIQPEGDE